MSYPDITAAGLAALARDPDSRTGSEFPHSWTCAGCGDPVHHRQPADRTCSSCRLIVTLAANCPIPEERPHA